MVHVPEPPFEVGSWVTPKNYVALLEGVRLRPGQAYRVTGWTALNRGLDERDWSIRLEGFDGPESSFPTIWFKPTVGLGNWRFSAIDETPHPFSIGDWVTPISGPGAGKALYQIESHEIWWKDGGLEPRLKFVGIVCTQPAKDFKVFEAPGREPLLSDYEDNCETDTVNAQVKAGDHMDFTRAMLRSIANNMNLSYVDASLDYYATGNACPGDGYDLLVKREKTFKRSGEIIPHLFPGDKIKKESPMSIIPPLEIPAAPQPEPLPPESASVQVLRKLVAERRRVLGVSQDDKKRHDDVIAYYEAQIAKVREMVATGEARIAAADAAIAEALADIEKLGGRPEEVTE